MNASDQFKKLLLLLPCVTKNMLIITESCTWFYSTQKKAVELNFPRNFLEKQNIILIESLSIIQITTVHLISSTIQAIYKIDNNSETFLLYKVCIFNLFLTLIFFLNKKKNTIVITL